MWHHSPPAVRLTANYLCDGPELQHRGDRRPETASSHLIGSPNVSTVSLCVSVCEDDLFTGVLKIHFLCCYKVAGSGAAAGDKAQSCVATGVTAEQKSPGFKLKRLTVSEDPRRQPTASSSSDSGEEELSSNRKKLE